MMDYWLIFNLLLPFIEVLLHTYMEKLTEDNENHPEADLVVPFLDDMQDDNLPNVMPHFFIINEPLYNNKY